MSRAAIRMAGCIGTAMRRGSVVLRRTGSGNADCLTIGVRQPRDAGYAAL
jgi:hypothetical protein